MKKENIDFLLGIESILSSRPSKMLWMIPTVIGVFFICVVLWLIVSQIDVVAPSQGKIIPSSRMVLIQPKETNAIKQVYVTNGQVVKKGELLVEFQDSVEKFDNNSLKTQYEILQAKEIFLKAYIDYIDNGIVSLDKEKNLSQELYHSIEFRLNSNTSYYNNEISSLMQKIKKVNFEMEMVKTELEKQRNMLPFIEYKLTQITKLVEQGLESEISMKDLEQQYIEQKSNISIKENEFDKLKSQYEISQKELLQFKHNIKKDLVEDLNKTANELSALLPDLNKSDYIVNAKSIYAMEDGYIFNLNNSTSGRVVQSGEVIMELIPLSSPLEVEAKVLNRDIGFVSLGQKVNVKIDSFKFTKYGYIEGTVTNIEKSSTLDENLGEIYRVIIELDSDKMKIDNQYIKLIPGMTCVVDIKIGTRRLIEYIISPMIRYKDEALREK
jgi:HlyD family type I secretion membrane fusion protein